MEKGNRAIRYRVYLTEKQQDILSANVRMHSSRFQRNIAHAPRPL